MAINLNSVLPSLGSALGSGVSQSLGNALDLLAQQKMQQLQQSNLQRGLQQVGINPQASQFISALPADLQKAAFQNLGALSQLQAPQESLAMPSASQRLIEGLGAASQMQGAEQAGQRAVQPALTLEQMANLRQALPFSNFAGLQQQPQVAPFQEIPQIKQTPTGNVVTEQPRTAQNTQALQDLFKSPMQKAQERQIELREKSLELKQAAEDRKIAREEQKEAMRETKEYADTVLKSQKASKENNLRLDRMTKLIEKGNLPNSGLWTFLNKIEDSGLAGPGGGAAAGAAIGSVVPAIGTVIGGIGGGILGSLVSPLAGAVKSVIRGRNPDVEEFEKLSADFVKNAKQYFGSRLTDADLRAFMQTVPTLMQTDSGKKRVIHNLKALNDASQIEANAARKIIKENGGKRPLDLEQQVQDAIKTDLDGIAKLFLS
jgi:hypothetical protein